MSNLQEFIKKTKKSKNTSKVHFGQYKTRLITLKKYNKNHRNSFNVLELVQSIN
jgi:uncharacterized protein YpmB